MTMKKLGIVLFAIIDAIAVTPAYAELERMSVSGSGGQTTFTSTEFLNGRTVFTAVHIFVSVPDGVPLPDVPTSRPFVALAVTQTDTVTGETLFDGEAFSNVIDFQMGSAFDSAHLQALLTVTSFSGLDSRRLGLNVNWTGAAHIETLSYSARNTEDGNVKKENHNAIVRQANSTGVVKLLYPGTQGHVLTLNAPGNPTTLWYTQSTGTRLVKPTRGGTGSNAFTLTATLATTCSSGSWSGFWTWNSVTRTWFWTWVWTPSSCGWTVS